MESLEFFITNRAQINKALPYKAKVEVAKEVGVDPTAVNHALSGNGYNGKETEKLIVEKLLLRLEPAAILWQQYKASVSQG